MKRLRYSNEMLSKLSMIKQETIHGMRYDKDFTLTFENVIPLCIGMSLEPIFSRHLLKKAGLKTLLSEKIHLVYLMLILFYSTNPISECNDILRGNGMPCLGEE